LGVEGEREGEGRGEGKEFETGFHGVRKYKAVRIRGRMC